ncbi:MAG: hypothetical protein AAGG44_15030, partial [Planctomycetota bacterium]
MLSQLKTSTTKRSKSSGGRGSIGMIAFGLLACCALALTACSRAQYRVAADQEAYCVIGERSGDPRWHAPRYDISLDSRSRYHEPYSIDCPPIPQDDPSSHHYMHCVDEKKGWEHWHDFGVRGELENPNWRIVLGDYVE